MCVFVCLSVCPCSGYWLQNEDNLAFDEEIIAPLEEEMVEQAVQQQREAVYVHTHTGYLFS